MADEKTYANIKRLKEENEELMNMLRENDEEIKNLKKENEDLNNRYMNAIKIIDSTSAYDVDLSCDESVDNYLESLL